MTCLTLGTKEGKNLDSTTGRVQEFKTAERGRSIKLPVPEGCWVFFFLALCEPRVAGGNYGDFVN